MIARFLLKCYFLLLPLKALPDLSSFIPKITLADLVYIPVGLLALSQAGKLFDRRWWTSFDLLVLAWFLVEALSTGLGGGSTTSLAELAACFYLGCLYFSMRLVVDPQHVEGQIAAVIASGGVWGLIAIGGWLSAVLTQEKSIFVLSIPSYPYLGSLYRAQALAGSPNMLLSFLTLGILFCWARLLLVSDRRSIDLALLCTMLAAMLLTFSRGVLVVGACMAIIYFLSRPEQVRASRRARMLLSLSVFAATSAFIFVSHVVVAPNNESAIRQLVAGEYIKGDEPWLTVGSAGHGYALYPSIYLELKAAALQVFLDSGARGVGGGNFNRSLAALKERGIYPKEFNAWDPHSTYFGSLAEYGLIGFVAVCTILGYLCNKTIARIRMRDCRDFVSIGLVGVFVAIVIEASCVDIMNFRQYWFLFALATTLHSAARKGGERTRHAPGAGHLE